MLKVLRMVMFIGSDDKGDIICYDPPTFIG